MKTATYPDLTGKIVLITGSSKALGAETARRFAAEGAKVVVNGRDQKAIENVADSIRADGGECVGRLSELADAITQKDSPTPIHKIRKMCDPAHGSPR